MRLRLRAKVQSVKLTKPHKTAIQLNGSLEKSVQNNTEMLEKKTNEIRCGRAMCVFLRLIIVRLHRLTNIVISGHCALDIILFLNPFCADAESRLGRATCGATSTLPRPFLFVFFSPKQKLKWKKHRKTRQNKCNAITWPFICWSNGTRALKNQGLKHFRTFL